MIYFYWYLGTGFFLLVLFFLESRMNKEAQKHRSLYDLKKPRTTTITEKLVHNIILPGMALNFAFFFWPVMILWLVRGKIHNIRYEKTKKDIKQDEPFKVTTKDLIKKTSIGEIEASEMVSDPLDSVPHIPFGHLNSIWVAFKDKTHQEDEIWTFSSIYTDKWRIKSLKKGYVILVDGIPNDYLVTHLEYPIESRNEE